MVTFSITFILALPRLQEKVKAKKKEKSKGKKKIEDENKIPEMVQNTYQVGKPLTSFHVEYFLLAEKDKFDIDINCWEQAAKIYYEDQSKITKTIQKEETTWITFSISNSIADVSPEELEKLFDTTVSFNISDSKKRLGNRAKNDNPKVFYGSKINPDVDENEICFEQLFGTIEEVANTDSVITIKQMLEEQLLKAGIMGTVFNQLFALPVDQHRPRFREIVNKFKVEDKLPTKTPYTGRLTKEMTEEEPKKGKKKGKESTSKTSKKNKELSTVDLNLKMEAKQFFTGMPIIIEEEKPVLAGLTYAAVLVSVRNLLDKEMAEHLNPLIVRIGILRNLPHEVLLENRISNVYFSYKLVNKKFVSPIFPVQRNITIDHTCINLVKHFNQIKLIQFLQTGLLTVQMIGILDPIEHKIKPSVFGQELYDKYTSMRMNSQSPDMQCLGRIMEIPTVVLANASFALIGLLIGHLSNKIISLLELPNRLNSESDEDNELLCVDTLIKGQVNTPFTNAVLLSNETNLEIDVLVKTPLMNVLHRVQAQKEVLNRIFMVIENEEKAIEIVTGLYKINQAVLGPSTIASDFAKAKADTYSFSISQGTKAFLELPEHKQRAPEVMMMVEKNIDQVFSLQTSLESESMKLGPFSTKKALTGFIIDAFDKIMIFVEGQMNGTLQQVWTEVMNMSFRMGKILYNSDFIFESRLYHDFIPYGGFHIITLGAPIEMYLTNPKTFLEGYIPNSCWKTLLNFDLLIKSTSMRSAIRWNLFPTAESLLSFDIEFGIPLHHQEPEEITPKKQESLTSLVDPETLSQEYYQDFE